MAWRRVSYSALPGSISYSGFPSSFLPVEEALLLLDLFARSPFQGLGGLGSLDNGKPLHRTRIAMVGCTDIPQVRLNSIAPTADAYFCEVAYSVFGLWET